MIESPFSLEVIQVATPCTKSWDAMHGDDRVRHCDACDLNVYNLSEMSRGEAEQLVFATEGRVCARYYRRQDGTVITADCPVGLSNLRKRLARSVVALGALIGGFFGGTLFASRSNAAPVPRPIQALSNWISPPQVFFLGDVCLPPPPVVPAPVPPPAPPQ